MCYLFAFHCRTLPKYTLEAWHEMYTNKKRSENDQYNETSNHIQMKGGGGSGRAWDPRGRGGPPLPPYPFICLWFDVSLYWSCSLKLNGKSSYLLTKILILCLTCNNSGIILFHLTCCNLWHLDHYMYAELRINLSKKTWVEKVADWLEKVSLE